MVSNKHENRHYPITTSYNSVDKNVQSIFLPLDVMQALMFCPKYCIKNNIITPNKPVYNLISFIGTLVFIFLYIFRTYRLYCDKDDLGYTTYMSITTNFDCIFYCSSYAMNFVVGITKTKNKIKFILTFQNIHRFLKNKSKSRSFIVWKWMTFSLAIGWYMIYFTYFGLKFNYPFYLLLTCYPLISFDFYIVYAIDLIQLLEEKIDLWSIQALRIQKIGNDPNEEHSKKMFQAYVDILECYDIYKDYFQYSALCYVIEVYFHTLVYVQLALEVIKIGLNSNPSDGVFFLGLLSLVLLWLAKNFTWQTILSKRCEKFYLAVQNIHDSCALIMKSQCSDNEKKLYKNVVRLHRASFSKLSACGLFYVDAALQLSLMGLLTNYTIVLLQFRFL